MIWEILACLNCDYEPAQAAGWRYESAIVAPYELDTWVDFLVPEALEGRQFMSQRECLRALRGALPERNDREPDEFGEYTQTDHFADRVEAFHYIPEVQMATVVYACFTSPGLTS
jgi:hypothetical protein